MSEKFKTRKQIAEEFGIDPRTLICLLKRKGLKIPSGIVCPADQERIYNALGYNSIKDEK